jgi:hypothetical protein
MKSRMKKNKNKDCWIIMQNSHILKKTAICKQTAREEHSLLSIKFNCFFGGFLQTASQMAPYFLQYVVHYRPWSKVVHYIGNRVQYGTTLNWHDYALPLHALDCHFTTPAVSPVAIESATF